MTDAGAVTESVGAGSGTTYMDMKARRARLSPGSFLQQLRQVQAFLLNYSVKIIAFRVK